MSDTVDRARSEARRSDPMYTKRLAQTDAARRSWRYKAAQQRIKKIVDGWPPLTDEQRTQLALLLHPGDPAAGAGR